MAAPLIDDRPGSPPGGRVPGRADGTETSGRPAAAGPAPFPLRAAIYYSLAHLGTGILWGLFNNGLPLYLDSYRLDPWLIGLLTNARSGFAVGVAPVVGRLSDRLETPLGRRRPFFLVGVPLAAGALLLLAGHPPFWAMCALIAAAAVAIWAARDAYHALLGDLFPMAQRGRVGGVTGLATGLGSIVFVLLAATWWEHAEFAVFALVAAGLTAGWAATFILVREPPRPARPDSARTAAPASRPRPGAYLRGLLAYPALCKFVLADCTFWLGLGGATPFVTLLAVKALHTGRGEAFLATLGYLGMALLVALPAGMLADRLGKKRVLTLGMVVFGVAALAVAGTMALWQLMLALALCGVGSAGASYLDVAQLADLVPPERRAELMGLGTGLAALMLPAGAVLAGLLVSASGPLVGPDDAYRAPFLAGGLLMLLAALLLQAVRPGPAEKA